MTPQVVKLDWTTDDVLHLPRLIELESVFGADAFNPDVLAKSLHQSTHIVAVMQDQKIVCYTATDQSEPSLPGQYIWQMVTDPAYRGQGFATRALYELIDTGEPLHLHVREDNEAALGLYLDVGFRIHSTVQDYYADGTSALHLTRPILN